MAHILARGYRKYVGACSRLLSMSACGGDLWALCRFLRIALLRTPSPKRFCAQVSSPMPTPNMRQGLSVHQSATVGVVLRPAWLVRAQHAWAHVHVSVVHSSRRTGSGACAGPAAHFLGLKGAPLPKEGRSSPGGRGSGVGLRRLSGTTWARVLQHQASSCAAQPFSRLRERSGGHVRECKTSETAGHVRVVDNKTDSGRWTEYAIAPGTACSVGAYAATAHLA